MHGGIHAGPHGSRHGRRHRDRRRPRRRLWWAAAAVAVVFAGATARLFVWPAQGMPPRVDAIVVMNGPGQRLQAAQLLGWAHRAPMLLVARGSPRWGYGSACAGRIPAVTVICFDPSPSTTRGEAEFAGRLASRYHWRSIALVTTPDQATRARIRMQRCFHGQVYVTTTALPAADWPWAIAYEWGAMFKALVLERAARAAGAAGGTARPRGLITASSRRHRPRTRRRRRGHAGSAGPGSGGNHRAYTVAGTNPPATRRRSRVEPVPPADEHGGGQVAMSGPTSAFGQPAPRPEPPEPSAPSELSPEPSHEPAPDHPSPAAAGQAENTSEFRWLQLGFEWGLVLSRGLVLLPVVVLVIAAAGSFVYGTGLFVWSAIHTIANPFPIGNRIGIFMLVIDLFLIGATLLIAAVGLYELFISRVDPGGERSHLPRWLVMNDLNDLKARVVSMLILVTAVTFVDIVVDFHGGRDILYLGIAAAVVIAALTAFLRYGAGGRESS